MLIERALLSAEVKVILDLFNVYHILLLFEFSPFVFTYQKFEIHFFVVIVWYGFHFVELFLDILEAAESADQIRKDGGFEECQDQDNEIAYHEDQHMNWVVTANGENTVAV
jgi:hypothetical protein